MAIQSTDLFLVNTSSGPTIAGPKKCEAQNLNNNGGAQILVNRGGQTYKTSIASIQTKVLDNDLLLVNRSGSSYRVTGSEIKAYLSP